MSLKVKLEEAKWKEEGLRDLIHEWEENCQNLKEEFISLRTNIDRVETKKGLNEKIVEGIRNIDHDLNNQRSSRNKTSLGYSRTHESFLGKIKFISLVFEEPKSYEKKLQEITNEDKRAERQRGDCHWNNDSINPKEPHQWRMNQSAKKQRYLHA